MNLFDKLKKEKNTPTLSLKKGHFVVDDSIGISLLTSLNYYQNKDKNLLIVSNLYKAQQLYNLICSFVPRDDVLLFPADELIRAETLAQTKEMVAHRLFVLNELLNNRGRIVITNLAAACRYLPNKELFKECTFEFEVGGHYDIHEIKKQLVKAGYSHVNKVDQSLQFASRGDILDIFTVNYDNPIRIEFFDDEIETIRYFDIATQRSVKNLQKVVILPASDMLLSEKEVKEAGEKIYSRLEKDQSHLDYGTFERLRDNTTTDVMNILEGQMSERLYKYYGLLTDEHCSIFDYCSDFNKIIVDETSIKKSNKLLGDESFEYLNELHSNGKIISHLEMFQDIYRLVNFNYAVKTSTVPLSSDDVVFDVRPIPYVARKGADAINIIHTYLNEGNTLCICLDNREHISVLQDELNKLVIPFEFTHDFDLPNKANIGISLANLQNGFYLPEFKLVFLSSKELFNEKVRVSRFDSRFKEGTILKSYEDLSPGDYVVHEFQGIGQFLELQTLEVDGVHRDYLKIAYHGGELLYVPLSQFQLVRKYLGKEGVSPRLSRLHSKDWENTKKKIKERVSNLAERLMNLYIERSKAKGFAFAKDDEFQKQFDESFDYEFTPDQERAWQDIKTDMESSHPMDRLLCGDVGFGKTEVAFRAAFKAILSGKQVAILCPTTLLARQHYELALERFSPFDVRIAAFSRLIPDKQQNEFIKEVASGKAHLVIGTHRLLSKDISFKDLGLLIIDEEQRFGVEQKERIKELKTNIDVLTLSATPIPRTLQISLLGVRSMSIINTAPRDRMPIQTYVTPFDLDVVKELIQRELGRNGQVFYMHNNISTLYLRASKIEKMLPGVTVGVAHGQMSREDIEDVMLKFYNGEIQVLVCTSIVENGIDVPNANMIIVEDSDRYGLSQLYQIKGRVGRSDRIAYAYLMYNGYKQLTEKAQKRLQALQDFTELGSGYRIAQRDLMIRGAGDILGPEQAGFIDSIGLDMYIKLLNEAVQEKMTGVKEEPVEANYVLSLDAYIPKDYANDSDKIGLYQEILMAPSLEDLANLKEKMKDIYGVLPKEVESLFTKRKIDLLIRDSKIDDFLETNSKIDLVLGKNYINIKGIGNILFEALIPYLNFIKVSYSNNVFKIVMNKRKIWIDDLENILRALANIIKVNKTKEIV